MHVKISAGVTEGQDGVVAVLHGSNDGVRRSEIDPQIDDSVHTIDDSSLAGSVTGPLQG